VKAGDDAVLATVLDPRFDVGRVALFDSASTAPTQPVPTQLPAALDLRPRVTSRTAGRITVSLDRPAPAGAALVVAENFYPGWTARVDGREAPVARVDFTLLGVPLPDSLATAKRPLIVGLIATAERISHVRQNRILGTTGGFEASSYVDRAAISEELAYARQICTRHNWPTIDVSRRSIEETALAIVKLYAERLEKAAE